MNIALDDKRLDRTITLLVNLTAIMAIIHWVF